MKKKKGFTLVELVVVMAILVIFSGLVLSLFLSQNKNFNSVQNSTELQNEARLVLTNMEDDIKVAQARKINAGACGTGQMLYQYELKVSGVTEHYAYIYDVSDPEDRTIKKCKIIPSGGGFAVSQEMATLSNSVKNVQINQVEDVSTTDPTKTKGDVYEIKLELVKKEGTQYEEKLELSTRVTTRN